MTWKCFPHYWPFVGGATGHRWILPTKIQKWTTDVCFVDSLTRLFNKQSHWRWIETLKRSCNINVNTTILYNSLFVREGGEDSSPPTNLNLFNGLNECINEMLQWKKKLTTQHNLILTYMRQRTGSALVQVMACRLLGAKPLPEPMPTYCQLLSLHNDEDRGFG